ncbi:cyclopropane-fatty-acyl-phospholipid synthase family protein [Mangrovicoccus sp. HB161399]|uniref:SAM-dependent methyltransferase n=1 Tax=Mangrovicoccus sp. HB161399 TaxID=2720392 RepID=UPI0015569445|nr:class I SAM-dependent methyltransferase [Mangrovicoccus sp. HB161399]
MTAAAHEKFDAGRAGEYAEQARIALAGYDACHELSACILSAALAGRPERRILVAGAGGTAGEILAAARLEPGWRFLAADPSAPMLALAEAQVAEAGFADRVTFHCAEISALPPEPDWDGALAIGVLHHLPGDAERAQFLAEIGARLRPGGSMVLAGNCRPYGSAPLLAAAWANRWRQHGVAPEEAAAKLARIQSGAVPPASEEAVAALLAGAGFAPAERFFASLFWTAWHAQRR